MAVIRLRKIKTEDKKYFAKWWRDKDLAKLTSGVLKPISDQELEKYFLSMRKNDFDQHFMIILGNKAIGHVVLAKRKNSWYETQIVIGDKKEWGKGYGTEAIKLLLKKAKILGIDKIYLEVRLDNLRAIRSYEKSGFKRAGIIKYKNNKNLPETLKMVFKS